MIGRTTDKKTTEVDHFEPSDNQESFFNVLERTKDLNFTEGPNPYQGRRVGISKKNQEKAEEVAAQWWKGAKCPSCLSGFTAKSSKQQCHHCDRFTHMKKQCLGASEGDVFLCKVCRPTMSDYHHKEKKCHFPMSEMRI